MFILKVINALDQQKVKYALVGGYAVALHGAVRGTIDVDIVIQISKTAFTRTEQALIGLGMQARLPVSAEDIYQFREEYIKNKNLTAWSFVNPKNPAEIVEIIITEDLKNIKSVVKKLGEQKIQVASISDLVRMKSKTKRKQDIEDVKALKELM